MRILLSMLVSFLVLNCAAQKNPPIDSREIISEGIRLYDSGEYKKALELYEQVDHNDTNYVQVLYERALTCERDSQYTVALQYCKEALSLPDQRDLEPQIHNTYGNIFSDMNKPDEAIAVFNLAIQKYPAYGLLHFNKGLVYFNLKNYKDAEACFKQAILIDPYVYSAHFYLGLTAICQGKLIPGMLSLTGYLLLSPEGKYAQRAINILDVIAKSKDEILDYKNNRTEEPDESYASVEDIVLSKLALDKSYKTLSELDDPILRQIQVVLEKIEMKSDSKDFWMQYYVPYYKSVFTDGKFEVFVNWVFENVNIKSIKEYNKKNKKTVEALTTEVVTYFNLIRSTRELQADKRVLQSLQYLYQNGKIVGKGTLDRNNNFLGSWEFYYPFGNLKSIGQFDDGGKRIGTWTFYFESGKLKSKETYKNGKVEGENLNYFENGNESYREMYTENKLNGPAISYYWPGTTVKIVNYKSEQPDGKISEFFANGSLRSEGNYVNGKLDGPYTDYFKSGVIKDKMVFKSGAIQGNYQTFFENGNIASEGMVVNGITEGQWKYYFESGKLKRKRNYVTDKIDGVEEEYFEDGTLSTHANYKKGKLQGKAMSYDTDGKLYCEIEYSNDLMLSITFYNKEGKTISHSEKNSNGLECDIFLPDGSKSAHQKYDNKGFLTGMKTIYFPSGIVYQTLEYQNGELNGVIVTYNRGGQKKSIQNWVDGKQDGHYIDYYRNGQVQSEGWMRNDLAQGSWIYYDELGNKTTAAYYQNGELSGYRSEYAPNGKMTIEEYYHLGWLTKLSQFDSTGKLLICDSFPQGSGKYLLVYPSGNKMVEATMKHGDFDGAYTTYYFDGTVETKRYYKKGIQDSTYISYYYGGMKKTVGQFSHGNNSETWNNYDEKGKLSSTMAYNKDGVRKIETFFFENDKKDFEIPYLNDNRDGLAIKYDPDGTLSYAVRYDDDKAVSYTYPGADGKLKPEIKIAPGLFAVQANFANGKPSRRCAFKDGKVTGRDTLFYSNGQIRSVDSSAHGFVEGRRVRYTPAGQLKSESVTVNDNLEGIAREYFDNGKLFRETPYYNGIIHGVEKIYDEQGHIMENQYYYGKLLLVKK